MPGPVQKPDQAFLTSSEWPGYDGHESSISVVDVFAGCGGLTLGVAEAAHRHGLAIDIPLALDHDPSATAVFEHNFRKVDPTVTCAPVEEYFDGALGEPPTERERKTREKTGSEVHLLVGGPPCQGHSDLNNQSRRDDPRNAFYARMARAAEVLKPDVVAAENVPAVLHDAQNVVQVTSDVLVKAGYLVADEIVHLYELGVPQKRRRHLLLACHPDVADPEQILRSLEPELGESRDLDWAIRDLVEVPRADRGLLDVPSRVSEVNQQRMRYLREHGRYDLPDSERPPCHQDGNHSYRSVYGRLRWDEPAMTITSGFTSMGQGRFVHPDGHRTLTPHEAARLQYFPDWFDFTAGGVITKRGAWATMIGNAVPPKLTERLVELLLDDGWLAPAEASSARPRDSDARSV